MNLNLNKDFIMEENYEFGQNALPKFNYHEMVIEKKLDRALRNTDVIQFQNVCESDTLKLQGDMLLIHENLPSRNDVFYTPDMYGYILEKIYNYGAPTKSTVEHVRVIRPIIDKVVSYQLGYMHKHNHHSSREKCLKGLETFLSIGNFPSTIYKLLHFGQIFSNIIVKMAQLDDLRGQTPEEYLVAARLINHHDVPDLKLQFYWSRNLLLMNDTENNISYVGPKDMSLLICNKLNDLCSVYLYTVYAQKTVFPANSFKILDLFIRELIRLCLKYKSDFFVIMKSLEAIINAEILVDVEDWENYEFLFAVSRDLIESVKYKYLGSKLCRIIRMATPNYKYELGCLSKILGHPYVDMAGGAESLFTKGTHYYEIDMKMVEKTVCYAKENFIKNYYARHKKWPPVILHTGVSKLIEYSCLRNLDPRSRLIPSQYRMDHNISDYHFVELQQCEDFKYLEQFIPYLKDRTITLLRQQVEEKFINEDGPGPWTDWRRCRLLLHYLISPINELNHKAYIDKYNKSATLEEVKDYLTVRIVPKEKELKEKFRGFGCKTYEDRARCLAQEKTAVEYLEKYSEEQAMALDEISLNKKLRSFRSLFMAFPQHKVICINIDASSWCGHQRREVVDVVMSETLDPIYGVDIYSKTQLAYETSLYYVPDGSTTYSKVGLNGGIEGLNQDTWVVVYLASVRASLETIKYKYFALCRGDDLRLVFCIPERELELEPLLDIKNRILTVLSHNMLKLGHEIKIQDSYGSEKLFTFCKQAAIRDLELTQSYRKIQKCHGSNNAFIETLDEYIASSFSNGHSAAKVSTTPLPSYYVACFWALWSLKRSHYFRSCDENQLIALLLVPSLAGGFPIIYLHNFYVRAESDLLTPFIDLYLYISKINPAVTLYMSRFMKTSRQCPKTFEALYNDPYSLPTTRPLLPTGYLRAQMPEALERITQNEVIIELLKEVKSRSQQLAIKALDSCNILHAKPLSVIYQALPKAMLSTILKMFESSKSVLQLLCNQRRKQMKYIITKAFKVECHLQNWRYQTLTNNCHDRSRSYLFIIHEAPSSCPVYLADAIRRFCWGKTVVGVTMPPITHLMTYYDHKTAPLNTHVNLNHFTYYIHAPTFVLGKEKSDHFTSSDKVPFVGFKTRPGTQLPELHFVDKDMFLIHLKNMVELDSWFHMQHISETGEVIYSNIREILNKVIILYTNDTIESLQPFTGFRRSGVVEHHLACQGFNASIVPNMNVNRYTRISGTTDSHSVLVHSSDKWKLNILHIFCHSIAVLTSSLDVSKLLTQDNEKILGVTTDCETCTSVIKEYPIIFDKNIIDKMRFKSLKSLKVSTNAVKILKETTELYQQKKFHDLLTASSISLEAAAMGVIMEELSAYNVTVSALQNELEGHVPNPASIELLRSLQITKSNKNTSLTEIKAIPVKVFAKVLSHLVTDYILRKYNKVYSIDQLSLLYNGPGHALPWYKLLSTISHTGMNIEILAYLQQVTKLYTVIISINISQQAVQLIPLAVTYSLYHDYTPTKFVMITDLIPEVNLLSLRTAIRRAIHSLLGEECLKLLDPEISFRRSLENDLQMFLDNTSWNDLPTNVRLRIRAFINGLVILCSKYNNPLNRYTLVPQSLVQFMSLEDIYNNLTDEIEYDDDDYDEETEFMSDFSLDGFIYQLGSEYSQEINDIENLDDNEDLSKYYMWLNKYTGGTLQYLLPQVMLTPLDLFKFLSHLPNYESYTTIDGEEVDLIPFLTETICSKVDQTQIELIIAPIVSCGQRLRQVLREMPTRVALRNELRTISYTEIAQPPKSSKLTKWIHIQNLQEGNQKFAEHQQFHARYFTIDKRIPLWKYYKRVFGHITSSYQILLDVFDTFKIQSKPMKILACGVGLGGDLLMFDHYFDNSDIWVLTHPSGNYSKTALLPYMRRGGENTNIFDEHLRISINDVGDIRSFEYLEHDFLDNIHIIWYDIEILPAVTVEEYNRYLFYISVYYLRNKARNGIMILKLDMSAQYTMAVMNCVSLLLKHNSQIYIVRSHTMIPCTYIYMIVKNNGENKTIAYDSCNNQNIFLAQNTFVKINEFMISLHEEIDNYENIEGYRFSFEEPYQYSYKPFLQFAPIYWRSLLSHNLNIVIKNQAINKILRIWHLPSTKHLSDIERFKRAITNFVFKYGSLHTICVNLLYNENSRDSLDNQESRITFIRRACMLTGFNDMLEYGKNFGWSRPLNAEDTHKAFIAYAKCNHNHYRDTHLNLNDDWSVLLLQDHNINGVKTGYHSAYNKGLSIGLSFLGWVKYCDKAYVDKTPIPLLNEELTASLMNEL